MTPYVVLHNRDENVEGGSEDDAIAARDNAKDAVSVRDAIAELGPCDLVGTATGDPAEIAREIRSRNPRVVFNLAEAARGVSELESCVAGALELLGVAYTGNRPLTLALCLDKPKTQALLRGSGVPVPGSTVVRDPESASFAGLAFPLIVKPACMDASHGIEPTNVVHDEASARSKAREVLERFPGAAIVEEFVDGRELNVSIAELDPGERPTVLALAEIDWKLPPGVPRVVGYGAKWLSSSEGYRGTPVLCPASLPLDLERRVREVALAAWDATGCRDYARVDMRVDRSGRPFVIEVNPNPCISPDAGLARSARASGIRWEDLVRRMVANALARASKLPVPDHAQAAPCR